MRKTIFLGLAAFALAGCPDPNSSTASAPKAATASAGPEPDAAVDPDFCEAKNPEGTNPCKKDSGAGKGSNDPGNQSSEPVYEVVGPCRILKGPDDETIDQFRERDPKGFECWREYMVKENARLQAEIDEIIAWNEKNEEAAAAPAASSAPQSGGGCEYKGRNYSQGESIYYPIDSSSLFVFGQSFNELAGKSSAWQQCDCSPNTGHWFCV